MLGLVEVLHTITALKDSPPPSPSTLNCMQKFINTLNVFF